MTGNLLFFLYVRKIILIFNKQVWLCVERERDKNLPCIQIPLFYDFRLCSSLSIFTNNSKMIKKAELTN